jgi:hypothetical protein
VDVIILGRMMMIARRETASKSHPVIQLDRILNHIVFVRSSKTLDSVCKLGTAFHLGQCLFS